ncbi:MULTISPECIES: hypothetical protein [unclassified Endozoicomonas]|uniref:hypothetical protein n=1 Tax=unclassified Endozoicomonas TaxID=2644528 RepID=UPI00214942E9|nr:MULTISPECIES: hypothetical protein [unclassified Endozoicomonas]
MLLLTCYFVCQAHPLTSRFVVELDQKTGSPNQSFSIKPDQHKLPCNPPDVVDTDGYSKSASLPENKRHKLYSYGVKTTIIVSISWQLLFATHLLVGHKLILTAKDTPLCPSSYSWLLVEMVVIVGWLLKNYWPPDSPLFNLIEEQVTTPILTKWDHAAITIMLNSAANQQSQQPSESSGLQAPKTTPSLISSFTGQLYSDSGDGNEGPQQQSHTLGLNCFVFPCNGVCSFRPSPDSIELAEWSLNSLESSCPHLAYGQCLRCIANFDPSDTEDSQQMPFDMLDYLFGMERQSAFGELFESQSHGIDDNPANRRNAVCGTASDGVASDGVASDGVASDSMSTETTCSTAPTGQLICDTTVIGKNGQPQRSGTVCENATVLAFHKMPAHGGQKTCDMIVIGKDGQPRPCGAVFISTRTLSVHKRNIHSGQKVCDVTVVGDDGKPRPCGKVFKGSQAISDHKRRSHTGPQACDMIVVGEDHQRRPCGMICKNIRALSDHKRRHRKRKLLDERRKDNPNP